MPPPPSSAPLPPLPPSTYNHAPQLPPPVASYPPPPPLPASYPPPLPVAQPVPQPSPPTNQPPQPLYGHTHQSPALSTYRPPSFGASNNWSQVCRCALFGVVHGGRMTVKTKAARTPPIINPPLPPPPPPPPPICKFWIYNFEFAASVHGKLSRWDFC